MIRVKIITSGPHLHRRHPKSTASLRLCSRITVLPKEPVDDTVWLRLVLAEGLFAHLTADTDVSFPQSGTGKTWKDLQLASLFFIDYTSKFLLREILMNHRWHFWPYHV